ncbi:MAG TPA: diaminopropionate ammonia-lyase [Acidimicrobiia bacterium]|nr:diaminopropionate ammonia-lyase [Acidimicrobiia bacterium]
MTILLPNHDVDMSLVTDERADDVLAFHRRLPGYRPTAVVSLPALASATGVEEIWIKDESDRFGLPAFKMLGASWASYRVLAERLGGSPEPWTTIDELAEKLAPLRPVTLATATDGNHGRAVARFARWLGLHSYVLVPAGTATARIAAIESEGAVVDVVDGTYDDAVAEAAALAGDRILVVSDTAWPGYERVPGWVIEGYSTIFHELDAQLEAAGAGAPDLVVVQIGVGALAAATVRHYRRPGLGRRPLLLGVEPESAACALASARAGELTTVPGPHDSIMAGLNCGTPSSIAWPILRSGIDVFVAIDDDRACDGMRALADAGLVSGETGAAGAGAILDLLTGKNARDRRDWLGLDGTSRVVLLSTEGATDPENYARIVGTLPAEVSAPPSA